MQSKKQYIRQTSSSNPFLLLKSSFFNFLTGHIFNKCPYRVGHIKKRPMLQPLQYIYLFLGDKLDDARLYTIK